MDKNQLVKEMNRLYGKYGIDRTELQSFSEDQMARGAKGLLAKLDKEKKYEYQKEDIEVLKDIFYYFG